MPTLIQKPLKTILNAFYGVFLNRYVVTYNVYKNGQVLLTVRKWVITYSKSRAYKLIENNTGGRHRVYPHLDFQILEVSKI